MYKRQIKDLRLKLLQTGSCKLWSLERSPYGLLLTGGSTECRQWAGENSNLKNFLSMSSRMESIAKHSLTKWYLYILLRKALINPLCPSPTTARRWHIVSPPIRPSASVRVSKNRGGSTSVRGRVRSPRISGGRRWLSCRQPPCYSSGSYAMGQIDGRRDRWTDRDIPKCPLGREHDKKLC